MSFLQAPAGGLSVLFGDCEVSSSVVAMDRERVGTGDFREGRKVGRCVKVVSLSNPRVMVNG